MKILQKRIQLLALLGLVMAFAIPSFAYAIILSCRSDPMVLLSDGTVIHLTTRINTSLKDVETIQYEVHVPRGVSANRVVHTPGWFADQEQFTLIADQQAGTYMTMTLARTRMGNAEVTADLKVMTRHVALDKLSITGPENTPLFLTVSH
jgi:hypothetical protein